MGNKSRRRPKVRGSNVKPPPRASNWIYTGHGRGYDFINLDQVKDARAEMREEGVEIIYHVDPQGTCAISGRAAEDVIAHLVMVGIDVTGAAEVLRDRFVQNIRDNLQALYVLEEEQLEAFHRGEIAIETAENDAGDAGGFEEFCVICGCTETKPCTGNDGKPCHWTRPGVMCSTCAEALEVLEKYDEIGDLAGMNLTPAETRVLEILEKHGFEPGAAAALRRTHGLHDPATDCAHDDKEECDDCNDCGAVLEERPRILPPSLRAQTPEASPDPEVDAMIGRIRNSIGKPTNCLECLKVDQPSCTWSNGGPAPCPGFERDRERIGEPDRSFMLRGQRGTSIGKDATAAADGFDLLDEQTAEIRRKELEVLNSSHRDNCWYGDGCHRFPRCFGCTLRNLRDRTSPASVSDVLEVTGKTSEELIERVRTCGVFVGLQKRGALFGKDYCAVGHEMREPACACCEYLRIASSPPPRKMTAAAELAAGHEAHDLAGGRAGGAGGEGDRDR